MSKPTESGYYWLQMSRTNLVTKVTEWTNYPEIVYVAMAHTRRGKLVPRVLGRFWQDDLASVPDDSRWSPKPLQPDCV